MGVVYIAKCEKCGYEDKVKSGNFTNKRFYNFYGCPLCKSIISVDIVHDLEALKYIKAGKCPKCKGKLIDYKSKEYLLKSKNQTKILCPRCNKYAIKLVPWLIT